MKPLLKKNFKFSTGIILALLLSFSVSNTAFAGETWNKIASYGIGVKSTASSTLGQLGFTRASNYFKQDLRISSRIGNSIDRVYSSSPRAALAINSFKTLGSSGISVVNSASAYATGIYKSTIAPQLAQFERYSTAFNAKATGRLEETIGGEGNGLSIIGKTMGSATTALNSATLKASAGSFQALKNGNNNFIASLKSPKLSIKKVEY